jgi:hypothetical protein
MRTFSDGDSPVSLGLEKPVDEYYGKIRALLNQAGQPIGENDLFLAAHALALDLTLVSANVREFSRVPSLRVENWPVVARRAKSEAETGTKLTIFDTSALKKQVPLFCSLSIPY